MRRKAGTVLPIERELLAAAVALMARGTDEFYGFLIAHEMRDRDGAKDLIAYGNLYRVLERMEKNGWLESAWKIPRWRRRNDDLAAASTSSPRLAFEPPGRHPALP